MWLEKKKNAPIRWRFFLLYLWYEAENNIFFISFSNLINLKSLKHSVIQNLFKNWKRRGVFAFFNGTSPVIFNNPKNIDNYNHSVGVIKLIRLNLLQISGFNFMHQSIRVDFSQLKGLEQFMNFSTRSRLNRSHSLTWETPKINDHKIECLLSSSKLGCSSGKEIFESRSKPK